MKFPEKLWNLINESDTAAIRWGHDGTTILIDFDMFETEIWWKKPDVFKTRSIVSFIRQLNLYGFRKCNRFGGIHEFRNPHFVRERKDLLKFMRRKLGSNLGISLNDGNFGYDKSSHHYGITQNNVLSKMEQPMPSSSHSSYTTSPLQEMNLSPENWWGNSMDALSAMKNSQSEEENILPNAVGDQNNLEQKTDENRTWGNRGMLRNIIFVPVPVHFGMYPGFFNNNLPMSFPMQRQEEVKNCATSEEGN